MMDLRNRFLNFIEKEKLFRKTDRLLVAVSGGLDSSVLCHLCYTAGFNFQIAHCNFLLRGDESTRDEEFVRNLAGRYAVPFHLRRFNTLAYAADQKVSVQVAARQLRYSFFSELTGGRWGNLTYDAAGRVADVLLTAHHADDNLETVMMNFFKGTGLSGLRGILPGKNNVVRPLLFARRTELAEYALAEDLNWVEDSSNSSDKYTRNKLRNDTLPLLEAIYPSVSENIIDNIQRFREMELIYKQRVDQLRRKLVTEVGKEIRIPVLQLKKMPAAATMLYEISRQYGFTALQANEMMALLDVETGKYVGSSTHRMIRHRNMLILTPVSSADSDIQVINSGDERITLANGELRLSHCLPEAVTNDLNTGFLDADKIRFPLVLRKRRQGDYFYPLGMKKKKKVSRFLSDLKMPAHQKDECWLLESDKTIIWLVGLRIDDRFKVTPATKQVLRIDFLSNAF